METPRTEYDRLSNRILDLLTGLCKPDSDWLDDDRLEQRVAIVVCDATNMSPERWDRLSIPQRIPWMHQTVTFLKNQPPPNAWVDGDDLPVYRHHSPRQEAEPAAQAAVPTFSENQPPPYLAARHVPASTPAIAALAPQARQRATAMWWSAWRLYFVLRDWANPKIITEENAVVMKQIGDCSVRELIHLGAPISSFVGKTADAIIATLPALPSEASDPDQDARYIRKLPNIMAKLEPLQQDLDQLIQWLEHNPIVALVRPIPPLTAVPQQNGDPSLISNPTVLAANVDAERDQQETKANRLQQVEAFSAYRHMKEVFFKQLRETKDKDNFVKAYAEAIVTFGQQEFCKFDDLTIRRNEPTDYAINIFKTAAQGKTKEVFELLQALLNAESEVPNYLKACPWNDVVQQLHELGLEILGFAGNHAAMKRSIPTRSASGDNHEIMYGAMLRCLIYTDTLLIYAPPANNRLEEFSLHEAWQLYDLLCVDLKTIAENPQRSEWTHLEAWKYLAGVTQIMSEQIGEKDLWPMIWLRLRTHLKAPETPFTIDALEEEVKANLARLQGKYQPIAPPPVLLPLPSAPIVPHRVADDGTFIIDLKDHGTGTDQSMAQEKLRDLIVIKDAQGNTIDHFDPNSPAVKKWASPAGSVFKLLFHCNDQFVECDAKSVRDYGEIGGKVLSPQDAKVWFDVRNRERPVELLDSSGGSTHPVSALGGPQFERQETESTQSRTWKLPEPRPIPKSIAGIADMTLRQRATDAWRAASLLWQMMDMLDEWWWKLESNGDSDGGATNRLFEVFNACLTSLYRLNLDIPMFGETPLDMMMQRFGKLSITPPCDWQKSDSGKAISGTAELSNEPRIGHWWNKLLGELLGFLQQLEVAPSVALNVAEGGKSKNSKGTKGSKQGRELNKIESGKASINFIEWGIGFDPLTGWHVFRFTSAGWKYTRKKLTVPSGIIGHMLIGLLKGAGNLDKKEILRFYDGTGGRPKKLNPIVTRLRKVIAAGIGFSHEDQKILPIAKEAGCWRLEIRIGHAAKTDPEFSGGDPEFTLLPCE